VREINIQVRPHLATASFTLRHAHNPDAKQMILDHESAAGYLHNHNRTRDVLDVFSYSVNAPTLVEIKKPFALCDYFGELYYDFTRTPTPLAEFPTYYAALFILSDVVRYQGQWKRLVDERQKEAVLVDRFLDTAIRKLPNLTLNELGQQVHLFKVGR
jgi:hypothetical protein